MSQARLFPDPQPLVERLGKAFFHSLPTRPGVYLMRGRDDEVVYVGKAKNLKQRLNSYRVANPDRLARRQLRLLHAVVTIEWQACADEPAALAKESELLLALKPKFNRAGVWPATPRFLVWQRRQNIFAFTLMPAAATGWQAFGPCGGGVSYLRAAVARLLWLALNPAAGAAALPAGWLHGKLETVVTISAPRISEPERAEVDDILTKLFAGDGRSFADWVSVRTQAWARAYDQTLRDNDLERVTQFIAANARRTLPFTQPAAIIARPPTNLNLPFANADWINS